MNLLAAASAGESWVIIVVYVVIIIGFMYFLLMESVEIGDSILTTSGFYGMVIDVTEDTVIVEFGGNKNCRIPMQKTAIVDIEKANA